MSPDLELTEGNSTEVVQICHRLDGIPLALELAAARVRVLSVSQIAQRLGDAFRLLTGGSRTALPRHQTLHACIDWSYVRLSPPERLLLQRLSVFGGGWALEAASVLAAEGREIEVIDLRSLLPWDVEAVLASVRKTGRALVLHEAPLCGGFGGEVAATIGQEAFEWLDAPVARVAALDMPVPFSKALEEVFSPKSRLLPALRGLVQY